jgi:putative SOS response-associated peptidase YedK
MPSSSKALMDATEKRAENSRLKASRSKLRMEPDGGTTNIRNVKSNHWTRWLGVEKCCVVPFNSLSEFYYKADGDKHFSVSLGYLSVVKLRWRLDLHRGAIVSNRAEEQLRISPRRQRWQTFQCSC